MDNLTPKFCRVCGGRLAPDDSTTGYDPYTGEPEMAQRLVCNNPTVDVARLTRKTSYTYHPTWQNVNGVWAE